MNETVTAIGLLGTYATGATGLVVFLWRHYEAKIERERASLETLRKELEAKTESLREELREEQRQHDQSVALFTKVLERQRLTSSPARELPYPTTYGRRRPKSE